MNPVEVIKLAELHIRVNKCLLVLSESELMKCLSAKPDIFQEAIRRGKGYIRAEKTKRWQEKQLSSNDEK